MFTLNPTFDRVNSIDFQTVTYQFDLMIIPDGLLCRNSNVEFRRT